mmetsp:Transcript_3782/g.11562  ORF Transcript_3782/g.11562 Transcript_3782/m.11562 type:complete len:301 (-) Transcript_3782:850-1752(-)
MRFHTRAISQTERRPRKCTRRQARGAAHLTPENPRAWPAPREATSGVRSVAGTGFLVLKALEATTTSPLPGRPEAVRSPLGQHRVELAPDQAAQLKLHRRCHKGEEGDHDGQQSEEEDCPPGVSSQRVGRGLRQQQQEYHACQDGGSYVQDLRGSKPGRQICPRGLPHVLQHLLRPVNVAYHEVLEQHRRRQAVGDDEVVRDLEEEVASTGDVGKSNHHQNRADAHEPRRAAPSGYLFAWVARENPVIDIRLQGLQHRECGVKPEQQQRQEEARCQYGGPRALARLRQALREDDERQPLT